MLHTTTATLRGIAHRQAHSADLFARISSRYRRADIYHGLAARRSGFHLEYHVIHDRFEVAHDPRLTLSACVLQRFGQPPQVNSDIVRASS
jgi:hypothetical protein